MIATPPPTASSVQPLTLAEWMERERFDDSTLGEKLGFSRSIVSRVRRGAMLPSTRMIEAVLLVSGGEVQPNSFFRLPMEQAA